METLIHADIFFFITSIFVVALTVGWLVILGYLVPILRDMKALSEKVKEEGEKITEDIGEFREAVKEEGVKVKSVFDFFLGMLASRHKIPKARKSSHKTIESKKD